VKRFFQVNKPPKVILPHYNPVTVEWQCTIHVSQICVITWSTQLILWKDTVKCGHCVKYNLACIGHMVFAPCVPCHHVRAGCFMNGISAIIYHSELMRLKIMVYDKQCDFLESHKVNPEVHRRYELGLGHAMVDDNNNEEGVGAGGNCMAIELVCAIHGLSKEMGWMQLRMHGMMGDMLWVMGELQQVTGPDSTSVAPPPNEFSFVAQPITGPISENNSTQARPNTYRIEPIYPATPTIDSWMHPASLNTPTQLTSMQSNSVPRGDTPTYQFLPALSLFDSFYQDNSGPQYIDGSSTGLSTHETGELWQQQGDFAGGDGVIQ
jgi:hypothetical protein